MATYSEKLRQGLPRVPGGEPWPAGGVAASTEAVATATAQAPVAENAVAETAPQEAAAPAAEQVAPETVTPTAPPKPAGKVLRQGLPRVPGGDPWPAGGVAAGAVAEVTAPSATTAASSVAPVAAEAEASVGSQVATAEVVAPETISPVAAPPAASAGFVAGDVPLRRGLPRVPGGESWPAEGFAPAQVMKAEAPAASSATEASKAPESASVEAAPETPVAAPVAQLPADEAPGVAAPAVREPLAPKGSSTPKPSSPPAAEVPAKPATPVKPKREPVMIRGKALSQWVKLVVLGGIGAIIVAAVLVLAARGLTTFTVVSDFIARFPGEYGLPDSSEPGFPWWARWSHFLNIFLMVLIIRSGILVRTQQKAPAYWTPKKGGKKISINLWLHTSLDVLWLVNGVIFVILLFVSNHWMRVVPTSWEVFPNAVSAMIQYATLDWPVENGWVNYNSIQQLMYFTVIFIAAPLATITGLRMSEWWPEKAEKLNKFYPAPLARALHFPTMLFFVLFILIHVFLVFSTGALKNLNHMFAGSEAVNWTGFWLFALAIFLTVAGWFAARPLVLAPVASLFGKVSNR